MVTAIEGGRAGVHSNGAPARPAGFATSGWTMEIALPGPERRLAALAARAVDPTPALVASAESLGNAWR